jgi:hypothetical protein
MSLEVRRGPTPQGQPSPDNQAAATPLNASSLPSIPGYVVIMVTRYGMPRRKVYLDLGHAGKAVARAQAQGRQAWLVLCELRPVVADLDLDGGDQS